MNLDKKVAEITGRLAVSHHTEAIQTFVRLLFDGSISQDAFTDAFLVYAEQLGMSSGSTKLLHDALFDEIVLPYGVELDEIFEENKKTVGEVIDEVKRGMELQLEERMKTRFEFIVKQLYAGEYDVERLMRMLTKGDKVGGLGLEDERAQEVALALLQYVGRIKDGPEEFVAMQAGMVTEDDAVATSKVYNKDVVEDQKIEGNVEVESLRRENVAQTKQAEKGEDKRMTQVNKKETVVSSRVRRGGGLPQKRIEHVGAESVKKEVSGSSLESQGRVEQKKNVVSKTRVEKKLEDNDRKVYTPSTSLSKKIDVAMEAREIINVFGLSFEDPELDKRVHDIVVSRLKDVRNPYQTRDAVMKPVKQGGLGMGVDEAQKFLRHIEEANDALHRKWQSEHKAREMEKDAVMREEMFEKKKTIPVKGTTQSGDILHVVRRTPPEKRSALVADHLKQMKPRMDDVRKTTQLTGSVEELRSYTIRDFRRLHDDPQHASMRIEDKIVRLKEVSFAEMKKGFAAWHQSEVMRIYKEQINQSVQGGISLNEVVEQRKEADMLYLTPVEVKALTALNARLRQ